MKEARSGAPRVRSNRNDDLTQSPDMAHRAGVTVFNVDTCCSLSGGKGKTKCSTRHDPSRQAYTHSTEAQVQQTQTERWLKATAKP